MRVLICGAGQVGFNIAKYLSQNEDNHITVLDRSPELIERINEHLEVRAILGYASHPSKLEKAGAKNADLLIAVTHSDEVNMIAAQIGHSIFQIPMRISRIRAQDYLQPEYRHMFTDTHLPIDYIISPEMEVARAISERLHVPGAFDIIPLAENRICAIGVNCEEGSIIANTPLKHISGIIDNTTIDLDFMVLGIIRNNEHIIPTGDDIITMGDQVYCMTRTREVGKLLSQFGHEEPEAHKIIIAGGGNIGHFLGVQLRDNHEDIHLTIIESNIERAEYIADKLPFATVIHGDALSPEILQEARIHNAESFVSVTDNDEVNILSGLLAKRNGCEKAVALVNSASYESLIGTLGIDTVINPRSITVSKILQHVRRGRIHSVHSIGENFGELIEADVPDHSPLTNKVIRELKLPGDARIGGLVRDGEVIIPHGSTEIMPNDRIVIFCSTKAVQKVEELICRSPVGF